MNDRTVADHVRAERGHLLETLRAAGPEAPTLAGDWPAREVARHMAAQDRLAGIPAFVARRLVWSTGIRFTEAYLDNDRVAALVNGRPRSWESSLRRLSTPPPAAVLRRPIAGIALWEHYVHHEDVRRPNGLPRRGAPDLAPALAWLLRYNASRYRHASLRLVSDDGQEWHAGNGPEITVLGPPGDIVLWLSGRHAAADIEVVGDQAMADTIRARLRI